MKQVLSNHPQEEYLRILGKGMVTIPKAWRDELGLSEGEIVKAQKIGNKMVIESGTEEVPYRIFSNEEIEEWLEEDRLPKALAKKVRNKLKSIRDKVRKNC